MEMKSDVSRLPNELSKIASVSNQLKMDEISSLSKLAKKQSEPTSLTSSSVITQAAPPITTTTAITTLAIPTSHAPKAGGVVTARSEGAKVEHMVIVQDKSRGVAGAGELVLVNQPGAVGQNAVQAIYPSSSTAGVQVATAIQQSDGMIVVASSNGSQFAAPVPLPQSDSTQGGGAGQQVQGAYAINVPAYVDLQGQTVQLVPVSGQSVQIASGQSVQLAAAASGQGQQLVYWPGIVQGSQLAVVQEGAQAVLQPMQYPTTSATPHSSNVITID